MHVLQRNHAARNCLSWIGTVGFLRIPLDHFDVCPQGGIERVRHGPSYLPETPWIKSRSDLDLLPLSLFRGRCLGVDHSLRCLVSD